MKFNEIKKMLNNKYSIKQIKKTIAKIKPFDIKRKLRTTEPKSNIVLQNEKNNIIIKIIKSKLSSPKAQD